MITVEKLKFGYRKNDLFNNLDLKLKSGSICGLLGKNGAGKTTLLKLISGMLEKGEGTILNMGYNPFDRKTAFLERIFYIPEEFDMPNLKGDEYATLYGTFYPKFSMDDFISHAKELEVETSTKLKNLSFGQKKKVFVAFALACNTDIIIMDEPTNGMDIPSKSSFRRLLSSIDIENRLIIISTHQVRDLNQLIDRVVILDNGEITVNASINEIVNKFDFGSVEKGDNSIIYSETTIQGLVGIKANSEGKDSAFDMELFFNAATTQKNVIKSIMNK